MLEDSHTFVNTESNRCSITRHPMRDRPCNNIRMFFLRLRSNSLHSYMMSSSQKGCHQLLRFVLHPLSRSLILLNCSCIFLLLCSVLCLFFCNHIFK